MSTRAIGLRRPGRRWPAGVARAQSLWREQPYDEFASEKWADIEVHRLVESHASATEELVAPRSAQWPVRVGMVGALVVRWLVSRWGGGRVVRPPR